MAIRSITAIHSGYEFEASSLATAVELAKTHGAVLRIVHAAYMARPSVGYYGEAAVMAAGVFDAIERQERADLERARQSAGEICRRHELPLSEAPTGTQPCAQFVPLHGLPNQRLVRELTMTDLVVKGAQKGSSGWLDDTVTSLALFSTTRPMLVVRPLQGDAAAPIADQSVCVAWRATPEAMHAVLGARTLLAAAKSVHLVSAHTRSDAQKDDEAIVLGYLKAHGVAAEVEKVSSATGGSAAQAVLGRARELGCGFMVMGAYGHSMFRESLLGGFSEEVISEAEFPLVLCH